LDSKRKKQLIILGIIGGVIVFVVASALIFHFTDMFYGFIIASAIVIGIILATFVAKMRGLNPELPFDAMLWAGPLALFGIRFYFFFFDGLENGFMSFIQFVGLQDGWPPQLTGLAIHGGIFFGILGMWIASAFYKRKNKPETFLNFVDIAAPFMLLGQAIGRWGNFANMELYGSFSAGGRMPFYTFIEDCNVVTCPCSGSGMHVALFFWEFLFNLIGALILLWVYFGNRRSAKGTVFFGYMLWYGTVRIILEGFRNGSSMGWIQYVACSVMITVGLAGFIWLIYRAVSRQKKLPFFVRREDWYKTGLPAFEFGAHPRDYIKNLLTKYVPPETSAAVRRADGAAAANEADKAGGKEEGAEVVAEEEVIPVKERPVIEDDDFGD